MQSVLSAVRHVLGPLRQCPRLTAPIRSRRPMGIHRLAVGRSRFRGRPVTVRVFCPVCRVTAAMRGDVRRCAADRDRRAVPKSSCRFVRCPATGMTDLPGCLRWWRPVHVERTEPLATALHEGRLADDTPGPRHPDRGRPPRPRSGPDGVPPHRAGARRRQGLDGHVLSRLQQRRQSGAHDRRFDAALRERRTLRRAVRDAGRGVEDPVEPHHGRGALRPPRRPHAGSDGQTWCK